MIERLRRAWMLLFGHHRLTSTDLLTPQPIHRDDIAARYERVPGSLQRLRDEFYDIFADVQIGLDEESDRE